MLGAIIGDVAGSPYEGRKWIGKTWDFELFGEKSRFTDDTVMSMAVADAIMVSEGHPTRDHFINAFHKYGKRYPHAGYGQRFRQWLTTGDRRPYNSWGNGGAMRVSPVAWAFNSLEEVERYARASAEVTHDHPEGVAGACSVAAAIFLARTGADKAAIRKHVEGTYDYDLGRRLADFGPSYRFSSRALTSVPEAIIAFMESKDFESAIRNTIWLGGDCDTQAAIAGSIAEAFYGDIPVWMADGATGFLDAELKSSLEQWQAWLFSHKS